MRRSALLLLLAGCHFQGADAVADAAPADAPRDSPAGPDALVDDNPPGGIFQPIVFWYSAEDAIHDGANHVTSWPDRGSDHLDLTGTATFVPATPQGAATLALDHDHLANPAGLQTALAQATLIAVVDDRNNADLDWLLYAGGSTPAQRLSIAHAPTGWTLDFTTANEQAFFQSVPGPLLLTYVVDSTAMTEPGDFRTLYANGIPVQSATSFTTYAPTAAPLEVGDHLAADSSDPAGPYQGAVGELYLAATAAHGNNRFALETYFALRYQIAVGHDYLDSMGRVVWAVPSGGYDQRVFGIANDFASRLEIDVGSSDDVLRFEATSSAPPDRSYLIAGDNGLDATFVGASISRVWKVVNNWDAPVLLEFAVTPPPGKTPILKYASDPLFTSSATAPLTLQANGRWTVTEGLPATAYVTLVAP